MGGACRSRAGPEERAAAAAAILAAETILRHTHYLCAQTYVLKLARSGEEVFVVLEGALRRWGGQPCSAMSASQPQLVSCG